MYEQFIEKFAMENVGDIFKHKSATRSVNTISHGWNSYFVHRLNFLLRGYKGDWVTDRSRQSDTGFRKMPTRTLKFETIQNNGLFQRLLPLFFQLSFSLLDQY